MAYLNIPFLKVFAINLLYSFLEITIVKLQ